MMIDHYPTDLFRRGPRASAKILFDTRRRWRLLRRLLLHKHDWYFVGPGAESGPLSLWGVYRCPKCRDELAGETVPFPYGYGSYGPRTTKLGRVLGLAGRLPTRYDLEHRSDP